MIECKHKAVIGLGNPGRQFVGSPHNAGYAVVEGLAALAGSSFTAGLLPSAHVAEIELGGMRVSLVKPVTGMNDSGRAFAEVVSVLALDFPEILVVVDDLSLPLSRIRLRDSGRRTAGHRGLASIFVHVPEHRLVSRLKVGIGPDPGGAERFAYVTSPLLPAAQPAFLAGLSKAAQAADHWVKNGLSSAMNGFNGA